MSANQRGTALTAPSRSQATRKKSKDVRESLTVGEVYHKISKWYPSISDTPEEPIVLTVNGGVPTPGQTGTKSRTESRMGTASMTDQVEPAPEPAPRPETKVEKAFGKLLQVNNKE